MHAKILLQLSVQCKTFHLVVLLLQLTLPYMLLYEPY
jgi:hypothetical protein